MKIAVFCPNWIGDVVMATPAFAALRRRYPEAKLIGVMRPYVAGVLEGHRWFDETVELPGGWFKGLGRTARHLRRQGIDLGLLFTNSFRTALVARLAGCQQRIGFARDGRGWLLTQRLDPLREAGGRFKPSPVIDAYNQLAIAAGTANPGYRMRLHTTPADEVQAAKVWSQFGLADARDVILLNPGAAFGSAKLWPAEYFSQLARRLVDQWQAAVLVLCGPAERPLARRIAQVANRPTVHSLADEELSLGLLKACVQSCDLLITTDSGPRHFAAAFDKPVVSLFGPTHIAWTETYHPAAINLQEEVPCGPCQQRTCPEEHHRCMTDLLPDRVFAAAAQLLGRQVDLNTPLRLPLPTRPTKETPLRKGA